MANKALSCPECGPLFGVLMLLSAFWDLVAAGLLFLGVVGWGLLGLLCIPLPMLVLLGLWLKFWAAARLLKPLQERYPRAFPPMSRAFFLRHPGLHRLLHPMGQSVRTPGCGPLLRQQPLPGP